ncbi:MAG TPA: aminotransferase class III-fold pyridoxal phosphate-dependent enzyme [Thermoanaerobaculia bacterium]|nr:aminotransferase class III-fold pyridoxal phosphate-dependent enzyme [Thermoanaerobaculia bacterium]
MARRPLAPIRAGSGSWLEDDAGGLTLDLTSAYGVAPLGHAHGAVSAAIAEQAERLVACPGNLYCDSRARFLERLHGVLPARLRASYLCNSGAEAMEAALKFALVATGRRGLVALRGGFHGRTLGALSLTSSPAARASFTSTLLPVTFVAVNDTAALDAAVGDDTAALVVEVVQGEGGVRPLEASFLHAAQEIAHARGALFVVDEIQTGFGRTGAWFAHVALGLEPDVVALAKGIANGFPLGATVYTESVGRHLEPQTHASTFGGNPLACAAGRATIETLERHGLPERAAALGAAATEGLRSELGGSRRVREIRGRGLMLGIELREKAGPYLGALLERHRMLALPAGPTVIRLLPPLVIEERELESAVAALGEVLA